MLFGLGWGCLFGSTSANRFLGVVCLLVLESEELVSGVLVFGGFGRLEVFLGVS